MQWNVKLIFVGSVESLLGKPIPKTAASTIQPTQRLAKLWQISELPVGTAAVACCLCSGAPRSACSLRGCQGGSGECCFGNRCSLRLFSSIMVCYAFVGLRFQFSLPVSFAVLCYGPLGFQLSNLCSDLFLGLEKSR